jgi:diadenosine tetraphosphate (Ap4A) HIT family hydrolase
MLNEVKKEIQKRFNPDGFNVGINIGENAGQTVSHVHIHLIPRFFEDVEDPRGGVRGVIPERKLY